MKVIVKILTATSLVLFMMSKVAHAQEIGWVDSIVGPSGGAQIFHDGKPVVLKPFLTVHEGDQFVIADAATVIVVAFGDAKTVRIDKTKSPFVVKKIGAAPTIPGNLLKWMSGLLDPKSSKPATNSLASMSTRGTSSEPLAVPYLAKSFPVAAAKRALYFSWAGGTAPYAITLKRRSDGVTLFNKTGLADRNVTTPAIDLTTDDYGLEICDATQACYEDSLRAVESTSIPSQTNSISANGLPPHTNALLNTLWLASVENGRWVVEAIQQLAEQSKENPTASQFLKRIEDGLAVAQP